MRTEAYRSWARRGAGLLFVGAFLSRPALGDTPLFSAEYERLLSPSFTRGHVDGAEVPLLSVVLRTEELAERRGPIVPITDHFAVARGPRAEIDALGAALGRTNLRWAPPRRLLMDRVTESVRVAVARQNYGVDGAGAVVGVVDSGIDVSHPSVRNPDGSTRIRWLLAFGDEPRGVHAELEEEYGCTEFDDCAVYDRVDIDLALESGIIAGFPGDALGHGTHVTSIAAGSDGNSPGIAPGAELVLVRATGDAGTASDVALLIGTRFVFDRATELELPAVVNLSLGSGFGAHDGTSALEQALDELAAGEGRAIVLASGNDGSLYAEVAPDYPEPVGLHAEVRVPEDGEVSVPLLTLPVGARVASGTIFVWISTQPGDEIEVAFGNERGERTPFVSSGAEGGFSSGMLDDSAIDDYQGIISNGVDDTLEVGVGPTSVVVGIAGDWEDGSNFELVLRGHATARLWVLSSGDVGPETNGLGVVFPRARSVGTVSVPATANHVIAVGASVNRNDWTDYSGELVEMDLGAIGARASFSGAGPSQVGAMKPDLIAPGGQVIAAMSALADPRVYTGGTSQFSSYGRCPDADVECFVVDDDRGVAMGTSMAAPIVTGAVALALARDPSLELEDLRRLLRASSREPQGAESDAGRSGAGVLDVEQLLVTQDVAASGALGEPAAERSRLVFGAPFAHPVVAMDLEGVALVRDASGVAVLVDERRLELEVDGPGSGRITHVSAGLVEFSLSANEGSAEQTLTVTLTFDDEPLVSGELPIFADAGNARGGIELTGGTCAQVGPRSQRGAYGPLGLAVLLLVLGGLRRTASGARRSSP